MLQHRPTFACCYFNLFASRNRKTLLIRAIIALFSRQLPDSNQFFWAVTQTEHALLIGEQAVTLVLDAQRISDFPLNVLLPQVHLFFPLE